LLNFFYIFDPKSAVIPFYDSIIRKANLGALLGDLGHTGYQILILQLPLGTKRPPETSVMQIMGMMSNRDNIPRPDIPDRLDCLPGGTFDGMGDYVKLMMLCWSEVRHSSPSQYSIHVASSSKGL